MITSNKLKFLYEMNMEDRLYCHLPTAIIGSGIIGAGASIFGASKAAQAQTDAANAAIAQQQQMYAQNKDILSPFIKGGAGQVAGQQALLDPSNASGPLAALLKLTTPGADMSSTLAQTPGYQFAQTQGMRAVNAQLAARGLGGSGGAVAKGAGAFTTGLAQNTWQSVVQALQNAFTGQASAGQNLINSGVTAGSALAGVGTNTANAISGSLTGAGSAQAAGYNAIGSGVGGAAGSVPSAMLLAQLMKQSPQAPSQPGGIYTQDQYNPIDAAANKSWLS